MAKYIKFTPDVFAIQDGPSLHIWWFPVEFSQSRLGDRVIGSNACTLIACILAGKIHEFNIQIWGYIDQPLTRILVTSIAESIIEGNEAHEVLGSSGQLLNINLTVPEALQAVQYKYPLLTEWIEKTVIVTRPMGETLAQNLKPALYAWVNNPPADALTNPNFLYIVLVADCRTVLFVYQPNLGKLTMIDSHSHAALGYGAVVAQSRFSELQDLCEWYSVMCTQAFGSAINLSLYELSFLYVQDIALIS